MRSIRRRCACGCGAITNPGKRYIWGHNKTYMSKEARERLNSLMKGNTYTLGRKQSEETKLKISLANMKHDPDYEYCDEWKDKQYRKDLRKDYCENIGCKGNYKRLVNHHINLNKKDCKSFNVMTLCVSCSSILHRKLTFGKNIITNHKDYLTINRSDKITYIHKRTRQVIATIIRIQE